MSDEEQRFLSEPKRRSKTDKERQMQKMNRNLNYMIAIMSVLIIVTTIIILNTRGSEQEVTTEDSAAEVETSEPQNSDEITQVADDDDDAKQDENDEMATTESGHTISRSADANVIEVWTNNTWKPYPTEQTGTHASVYEQGNIDYEEKLAAAFSVLPIEQSTSYVLSARNNGDVNSARIVVTNSDKSENYRVIIQWVDGQGWQPKSVDVLHSADGVK